MLLDTFNNATVACSVRKLRTAYSGSCIRVRRDSDNTEQDIGFDSNGVLDVNAIASFCLGANGYLTKWYNQADDALSSDAEQIIWSRQPLVYDGSDVIRSSHGKPAIQWNEDGSAGENEVYFQTATATSSVLLVQKTEDQQFILFSSPTKSQRFLVLTSNSTGTQFSRFDIDFTDVQVSVDVVGSETSSSFQNSVDTRAAVRDALSNGQQNMSFWHEMNDVPADAYVLGDYQHNSSNDYSYSGIVSEFVFFTDNYFTSRQDIENDVNSFYQIIEEDFTPPGPGIEVGYKISNSTFPQFPINISLNTPITVNLSVVEQTPDDFVNVTRRPVPITLEGEDRLPPQITVSLEPEKPGMVVSGLTPHYAGIKPGEDIPLNLSIEDGFLDPLARISFDGTPINTTGTAEPVQLSFSVSNPAEESWMSSRTETIKASVPFPSGEYLASDLNNLAVSGKQTSWLPLQYWGDNSVKIAQAQFTDTIPYNSSSSYVLASSTNIAYNGSFSKHPWVGDDLQIGAMVTDRFNKRYVAFVSGSGETVQSTGMVQTKRYRTYHQPIDSNSLNRDFLTSTYYVTQYKDVPFTIVDWIIGNDYSGIDNPAGSTNPNDYPLGNVDVNSAYFLVSALELNTGVAGRNEVSSYFPGRNDVEEPVTVTDYPNHSAFRVMNNTWIGDLQTRRYRFIVKHLPENPLNNQTYPTQRTYRSMLKYPMFPLASFDSWKTTNAAGLLGGPIAGGSDSLYRAQISLSDWQNSNTFGTWGRAGLIKNTTAGGAPINQALTESFANAVQSGYHRLIEKLEGQAWIQAVRPYHLYGLKTTNEDSIYLWRGCPFLTADQYLTYELLGRRRFLNLELNSTVPTTTTLLDPYRDYRDRYWQEILGFIPPHTSPTQLGQQPLTSYEYYRSNNSQPFHHGWNGYDWEHQSVDFLFEYYMLTGDPWAHEELKNMGYSTISLFKPHPTNYTGNAKHYRAEGLGVQTLTNCYQATRIELFKESALKRVKECVLDGMAQARLNHPGNFVIDEGQYGLMYGPYQYGWPGDYGFYVPWHATYVFFGYLGAYLHFGDQEYMDVCEDSVRAIDYAWLSGVTDINAGYIEDGVRYYVPTTSAFNGGNYTNSDIVPANYFDNIPIQYPGYPLPNYGPNYPIPPGEISAQIAYDVGGALNSAVKYLRAGLLQFADITNNTELAEIADDRGEIILRGGRGRPFPESERHDKWTYNIPHDIT